MAVNVDTVYQRVLAIANKEQRGYITPQEFNLFANQAQMEIFEQYFYDLNQAERIPSNFSQYNDPVKILLEKIQIFEKRLIQVEVTSVHNNYLPADVYRLGDVVWYGNGGTVPEPVIIEEVTERMLVDLQNSPLATYSLSRPVFCRRDTFVDGKQLISIYPKDANNIAANMVSLYFTQNGDTDSDTTAAVDAGGNFDFIEAGQTVTGSGIPVDTTVVSIAAGAGGLVLSNAATTTVSDVTLTFASDDIRCTYIRKPIDAVWGYEEIAASDGQSGSTALYNSSASTNFELHASEENELILQILKLMGITMQDQAIMQYSSGEIQLNEQQRKS